MKGASPRPPLSPVGLALLVAMIGALLAASPLGAQQTPADQPLEERPRLQDMTDEQLRRYGFEWEVQSSLSGSAMAGVLAIVPGSIFHGLGHFYLGDQSTGWSLIAAESLGLGLVGVGILMVAASDDSVLVEELGVGVVQIGGVLIGTSWLVDVLGSIRGSKDPLPDPVVYSELLRTEVGFRFVDSDDVEALNLLELRLDADLGFVQLGAAIDQDIQLQFQRLGALLSLKPVEGRNVHDYMLLRVKGERASFGEGSALKILDELQGVRTNNTLSRFDVSLEMSLDLGQIIDHMNNAINVLSVGVVFAQDVGKRAALPGRENKAIFVLEERVRFHISQRVVLEPYYIFSEATLVEPLAGGLGVFGVRTRILPSEGFEVFVDGTFGGGYAASTGLTWYLF